MSALRSLSDPGRIPDILLPLAALLMEACWVYLWLAWVGTWQIITPPGAPLGLASAILLLGGGFLATRFFLSREWPLRWIQAAVVCTGMAVVYITIQFEYGDAFGPLGWTEFLPSSLARPVALVLALAASAALWGRGISWGRSTISFDGIYSSFLVGLASVVALVLVWSITMASAPSKPLLAMAALYVVGFFFCGLAALALSNFRSLRAQMLKREGMAQLWGRRWLSMLFGVVGGIMVVGVGIAGVLSFDLLALLGPPLNLAADLFLRLIYYLVLIPLGYLAALLVYVFQSLLSLVPRERPEQQPSQPQPPPDLRAWTEAVTPRNLPPEVFMVLKWAVFSLVALAVIFLLARVVSRRRPFRTGEEIEEIDESLDGWKLFKGDLRSLWNTLQQRLQRGRGEAVHARARLEEGVPGRLGIREIYRRLLGEASGAGLARRGSETPHEYARRLGQALPEGVEPLEQLTASYIPVRYGELHAEPHQVERANAFWEALRSMLRRARGVS